jgi:hypothetical protein
MPDANDLSLEEWKAVVALIRETVTTDRFPYSDHVRVLRAALLKLDPSSAPKPHKERPLPLTGPVVGSRRKRGCGEPRLLFLYISFVLIVLNDPPSLIGTSKCVCFDYSRTTT